MKTKKTIPLLFSFLAVASIISIGVLGNNQNAYAGNFMLTCQSDLDCSPGNVCMEEACEPAPPVAGELLPIDSSALMIAGLTSMTVWMVPTVLGLAGVGVYLVKFRKQ